MRVPPLGAYLGVLILLASCSSSDSGGGGGGEVRSQEDVQNLFEAIMPDLVDAMSEFARSQSPAFSEKQEVSSVPCPQGGSLDINTFTGQASLVGCAVSGVTIVGDLSLFVQPTGPASYSASFFGPLTLTGAFTGTVEVIDSLVQWTDPATDDNTFWQVTVYVPTLNETFTASSAAGEGQGRCESACAAINSACMSIEDDCVSDCVGDFIDCAFEMGALLDCMEANPIQCDPNEDQGLAQAPCAFEHSQVEFCGKDPF